MRENERRELDCEATVLISRASENSEGKSSIEEDNVATTGSSTSNIYPTPYKTARKNVLNPDLAAGLELHK